MFCPSECVPSSGSRCLNFAPRSIGKQSDSLAWITEELVNTASNYSKPDPNIKPCLNSTLSYFSVEVPFSDPLVPVSHTVSYSIEDTYGSRIPHQFTNRIRIHPEPYSNNALLRLGGACPLSSGA